MTIKSIRILDVVLIYDFIFFFLLRFMIQRPILMHYVLALALLLVQYVSFSPLIIEPDVIFTF